MLHSFLGYEKYLQASTRFYTGNKHFESKGLRHSVNHVWAKYFDRISPSDDDFRVLPKTDISPGAFSSIVATLSAEMISLCVRKSDPSLCPLNPLPAFLVTLILQFVFFLAKKK